MDLLVQSVSVVDRCWWMTSDYADFSFVFLWNNALCYFQMGSQYQRSVPLEVRRAEGEKVRAKHPDKIPVGTSVWLFLAFPNVYIYFQSSHLIKDFLLLFSCVNIFPLLIVNNYSFFSFIDHCGTSCKVTSSRSGQKEIPGSLRFNRWKHGICT